MLRLPYFLEFYREKGAGLFVIADNESTDGTTEYLTEQPDVLLFRASGSYAASRSGIDWLNALLHEFGRDRWCLTVDTDELLVFPHCERLEVPDLTDYLDARGANALPTFMLDMYSQEPIREVRYQAGWPFLSVCPFFDPAGYLEFETVGPGRRIPSRGGPRHRLFWEGRQRKRPAPVLVKYPLVRWSKSLIYEASTHVLSNVRAGDVTGVLLHFKFLSDFVSRAEEEVGRREHFDGASQYSAYWEVISGHPGLCAYFEGSVRYGGSRQLMEMGLMHSSVAFDEGMQFE
ncbi:glycosyltransferase family 2 protein [Gemmatimonadota bacterium]